MLLVLVGIYLARVPAYDAEDFIALQKSSFAPFLKDLAFRWHAAEVMLDLVLIAVCYYIAFRLRFEGEDLDSISSRTSPPRCRSCSDASWRALYGFRTLSAVVGNLRFTRPGRGAARRGNGGRCSRSLTAVYLYRLEGFSRAVFVLDALLLSVAIVATRASFRAMNLVAATRSKRSRRVLGLWRRARFGQTLVREMRANALWNMKPGRVSSMTTR